MERQQNTLTEKKKGKRRQNTKEKHWCLCHGPEHKGDMVACDNENCKIQWFHLACVGLKDAPAADDVWFCSSCSK